MNFQTFVKERLVAITSQLNAIVTNAKKIDDLQIQSNLDPASKIHVSRGGVSESLEVQKIIDSIKNNTYNQLISIGAITTLNNEVSIPADARWQINGIRYNTIAVTKIPMPYSVPGTTRTDIIVANILSKIVRIAGAETAGIAVRPNIPVDSVLVTEINVSNTVISDFITPVIGDALANKLDRAGYNGTAMTLYQQITSLDENLNTRIDDVAYDINEIKLPLKANQLTTYTKSEVDAKINNYFKGIFLTEAALIAAFPTASIGDYAQVNETGATDVVNYNWDSEENTWVKNAVAGSGATNTDQLPEGTSNLYFTVARFISNLTYARVIAALGFTPSTAPNNAQKNSDITKAEIEAKLTGEITSHTHPSTGGGDMVLASTQTVSGLKTFLVGMFGLRNVANTFTSFFTNSNTASRTYTFQNRDGTIADLTDIAGVNTNKMNTPAGTVNFLSKFITASTIGLSRLFDDGTFFGIGTSNAPTKDFTLGNQSNREIGVEESQNTIIGRTLIVSAGRTVNYVPNVNFNSLNQLFRGYTGIAVAPNGNVYVAVEAGDIFMQTNGTGSFNSLGQVSRAYYGITAAPNGNIYATVFGGDIFIQTNGTGSFVALNQTFRDYVGVTAAPNGNIYAVVSNGDIFMQTNGTGSFNPLNQTFRNYRGITAAPNGNIYATVSGGDIFMQTNGTGSFNALSQTFRNYFGITASPNGNIYVAVSGGDIFMQTNGTGSFNALSQTFRNYFGITASPNGNVYVVVSGGDIFMQNNDIQGSPNLNGGKLIMKAGTGKGTGQSRFEIVTGQRLVSGTAMQIETLREYVDENGYHIYMSMPVFADNASAIAGGLPTGCQYRTAGGILMIVI